MDKRLNRYILLTTILLHQIQFSCVISQSRFSITGKQDKAIRKKFVIKTLNMAGKYFSFCLARCLEECLCKSFQVCDGSKCELSSINRNEDRSALGTRSRCVYYDLDSLAASKQQCSTMTCSSSINCCMTSNPCLHGGVCLATNLIPSTKSRSRFRCECPQPYTGPRCKKPVRSCRGYRNGPRTSGLHKILDSKGTSLDVYCEFDPITSLTWTLVQSHVRDTKMKSLKWNSPISPDIPSWSGYRLQKSRMQSIQVDSSKWRITCQYNGTTPLTDYVYGAIKDMDILEPIVNCAKVEFIKIRNESCSNCTAHFFQNDKYILHHYSSSTTAKCEFNMTRGAKMSCDGEYFGLFDCKDKNHTCSSSLKATTQIWFGGY